MKAMILAAGLGTRLRPLTDKKPKPLISVANIPVIDRLADYLQGHGVREIIVNAHHHREQIVAHLKRRQQRGIHFEVSLEPEILGTGGGLKKTEGFWGTDPFVAINGDILTDLDITKAYEDHLRNANMATLVLHDYEPFNQIQIDKQMNVLDIASKNLAGRLAFTGVHVIDPKLLDYIPENQFFNIIDCYRTLIQAGKPIRAFVSNGHYWRDIGTIESYTSANREYAAPQPILTGPATRIHSSARLKEWVVMGKNTVLEKDVVIERSILWENVTVKKGVKIKDSIVTDKQVVADHLTGAIY